MQSDSQRTIEPMAMSMQVSLDANDMDKAFAQQPDPDEQLYYNTMGPGWVTKTTAEQLRLLADLVDLATAEAASLNLKAGTAQPK